MSRKLAMDNISLISKDGFAHTEYSLDYHDTLKNQFKTSTLTLSRHILRLRQPRS